MEKEEIKVFVENWLCQLGNVDNPDKAVPAIMDLIYRHNPPHEGKAEIMALGQAQALFAVLKKF